MKKCNIKFRIMCKGCQDEMNEAYEWQQKGFNIDFEEISNHIYLWVFNDKGEVIVE